MNPVGLKKKLDALRERRARIDAEIEQLEAQLDVQERAEKKGAEVLEFDPARAGGELHGPYWYLYLKKDGKTRSKYVGKNRPAMV